MSEYLHPGVYVEEKSFRAKSIQGVATSTCGMVGMCRFGPTQGEARLITSFDEFERYFGSIDDLRLADGSARINYLAHAVRLFFDNGGRRVYIARIVRDDANRAATPPGASGALFRARFPGLAGNLPVQITASRTSNLSSDTPDGRIVRGLRRGDMVEAHGGAPLAREVGGADPLDEAALHHAEFDEQGRLELVKENGTREDPANFAVVQKVALRVNVGGGERIDSYDGLSTHPLSDVYIARVLRHEDPDNDIDPPVDRTARVHLELPDPANPPDSEALLAELLAQPSLTLDNGTDGSVVVPDDYRGSGNGEADNATGLQSLAEIEDIAIVAAPDAAALDGDAALAVRNHLITHCENLRYRFAILSAARDNDSAGIRDVRGQHDSTYAGLYYPWVVVRNPLNAAGPGRDTIAVPPDGAIAGIYARSDIERGVHKAPANEVVRSALRFSRGVNERTQDVLNPEGINCLRFFEGRGNRVWGARTISSDPEWTYLNVRRLFIFMEASIDRGTQWAVFEPNNEELWLKIRLTIESFLYDVWRTGALMGTSPEEAFFVRCDRTTMSQGDLDNGRLVCLIGVAPTKPAEFVVFRIGQWTAEASII